MGDLVYRCVIAASRAVFRGLGLRIELRGEEHLPTTGGAVLASNHLSFLDFTFLELVGVERGRPVRFLCKECVRSAGGRLGDAPDGPPQRRPRAPTPAHVYRRMWGTGGPARRPHPRAEMPR